VAHAIRNAVLAAESIVLPGGLRLPAARDIDLPR
jgi:hypothetical protein